MENEEMSSPGAGVGEQTGATPGGWLGPGASDAPLFLKALVESTGHLVWIGGPDGRSRWASAAWALYTGDAEPPPGDVSWLWHVHPDDRLEVEAAWARATAGGSPFEAELRLRRHDGSYRWFRSRAQPQRDGSGDVLVWIATHVDVQELRDARDELARMRAALDGFEEGHRQALAREAESRRQAQSELVLLSERQRLATEAAGIGVWEWDLSLHDLKWDDAMYRLYDAEPAAGVTPRDVWERGMHPEDRERVMDDLRAAVMGARPFDCVFRIRTPAGRIKHVNGRGVVLRRDDGSAARMVGVNWDLTRVKEAKAALQESKTLLQTFVKHAPAAIAMLDRDLRYMQVSDRWLTEYGLDGMDLIGLRHYDVFPEVPERWKRVHARALQGAVERCEEDPFERPQGTMWLQWEVRPWYDAEGQVGGLIFFTHSITAHKEMELSLQRQAEALRRSNAELEEFAYVASHDLKEPLRAVTGCAQLLSDKLQDRGDPALAGLLNHLVEGATRMHGLINDLLALSSLGVGEELCGPVDTGAACALAVRNLESAIAEADAVLSVGALPPVWSAKATTVQLFQNLIGNAIKYRSKARPQIRVVGSVEGELCRISVIDNGLGIDPAYQGRIFGVFQRLHGRSEYPGNGIGLALCRKIVETQGGRIWVESQPGAGSAFHFTLPTRTQEAP